MKKIVGILAAAAVLATSVFAVDFSAGIQLKGELFKYDGATKGISGMMINHENSKDDKPVIFSLSSDRVGATLKFFDGTIDVFDSLTVANGTTAGTYKVTSKTKKADAMVPAYWSIWFKPFDFLQIDLGQTAGVGLNTEHITWWQGNIFGGYFNGWDGIGDTGYKATFSFDALKLAVALLPGYNTAWISVPNGKQPSVGETAFYAEYSGDFGGIKVVFDAKNTFDNLKIGAGYNGKFGAFSMFIDAGVKMQLKSNVTGLNADLDLAFAQDAFSAELWAGVFIGSFNAVDSTMAIPLKFKAAYALNGGSLYFKFQDDNLKIDGFKAEFEVGYDGNLGAMAYNVAANINVAGGDNVTFKVPVTFKVSF